MVLKSDIDIEIGPVHHRLPHRIRAHALVRFVALIQYRVVHMRLKANRHEELPSWLIERLQRIQQQTVKTAGGKTPHGLIEMTRAQQKSLRAALQLPTPTLADLAKHVL